MRDPTLSFFRCVEPACFNPNSFAQTATGSLTVAFAAEATVMDPTTSSTGVDQLLKGEPG